MAVGMTSGCQKSPPEANIQLTIEYWCDGTTESFPTEDEIYVVAGWKDGTTSNAVRTPPDEKTWPGIPLGDGANRQGPFPFATIHVGGGRATSVCMSMLEKDGGGGGDDFVNLLRTGLQGLPDPRAQVADLVLGLATKLATNTDDWIGSAQVDITLDEKGIPKYNWFPIARCTWQEVRGDGGTFEMRLVGDGSSYKVILRASKL